MVDLELFSLPDQNGTELKGQFTFDGQFSLSMGGFSHDTLEDNHHTYKLSRENIYFLLTVFGSFVQGERNIESFWTCNNDYQLMKFAVVDGLICFSIGTRNLDDEDYYHNMYLGEEDIYWLIVRLGNFLNMGDIPK